MYMMTMVDRTTRWLEAVPLKSIAASTCIEVFCSSWIARFGLPQTITTDRGAQFASASWTTFCGGLGIRHVMTTSYHPQSNGLVERSHRQLKDALRARGASVDWPAHLPWALLGLRAAPKEVSGLSSAEAVFGQPLVLPRELVPGEEAGPAEFSTRLASSTPPSTSQPRTYAEAVAGPPDWRLQLASMVYIRRGGSGPPLAPAYAGPYKVVRPGHKYFVVEVGGRQESVSVDRLKPHLGASPLPAASPPRRGRPPREPPRNSSASP
jgi:hypothetical protein